MLSDRRVIWLSVSLGVVFIAYFIFFANNVSLTGAVVGTSKSDIEQITY